MPSRGATCNLHPASKEVTGTMSYVTGDTEKFTMRFSVTYLLICRNKRRYIIQNMCILYFEF
jgi:hypothetical protein